MTPRRFARGRFGGVRGLPPCMIERAIGNLFGSGSRRRALLDGMPIAADLLTTVVPQRGTLTPSFVRATTATEKDFEGRQYTALAGEARFRGVRRTYNRLASGSTEDVTNAAWAKGGTAGTPSANTLTLPADNDHIRQQIVVPVGQSVLLQAKLSGTGTVTIVWSNCSGMADVTVTLTSIPTTYNGLGVVTSANPSFYIIRRAGNTATSVTVTELMALDVTGCSDQTTLREYVSVGAVQRNLIKFSNQLNNTSGTTLGWTQASTPSPVQDRVGPTGVSAQGWTLTDNSAGNTETIYATHSLAAGTYTLTAYVAKTVGAQSSYPLIYTGFGAGGKVASCTVDTTNGVATVWTAMTGYTVVASSATCTSHDANWWKVSLTFAATTDTWYSQLVPAGTTVANQSTGTADVAAQGSAGFACAQLELGSVATAYQDVGATYVYHGSCVDGVKCFATDYSGNPLPTSDSATYPALGYHPEPLGINVCTYSNTLTSWNPAGTPAATQNAVGPNGQANYAWTLTDNAAGVIEGVSAIAATLTAAPWTASVLIAKTTGPQAAYPVLFFYLNVGTTNLVACTVDTSNGVATLWSAYTGFTVAPTGAVYCRSYNDSFWEVGLSQTATAVAYKFDVYPAATTNPTQSTGIVDTTLQGSGVFCDAQIELGTKRTSYIATGATAVQRDADVLTYTGADVANIKTLHVDSFRRESGVSALATVAALSDGTSNNFAHIYLANATVSAFSGSVGGVQQWVQATSDAYTPGTQSKASFAALTNDIKMDFNGVAQTPDTSASVPAPTKLEVGCLAGLYQLNGTVRGIYADTKTHSQSELGAIDR